MKMVPIMLGLTLILPISALAELHTFRLPDGRELQAEIVGFNPHKNLVELKKENGKTVRVKPDLFVSDDRHYIEQWYMADVFMLDRTFEYKANRKMKDSWKEGSGPRVKFFKEYLYECIIKNKSKVDFTDLKINYCLYWEEEKSEGGKKKTQLFNKEGFFQKASMKASEELTASTELVVLRSSELDDGYIYTDGSPSTYTSEMQGIWIQIIFVLDNGQKLVREFSTPDHLMSTRAWEGEEL